MTYAWHGFLITTRAVPTRFANALEWRPLPAPAGWQVELSGDDPVHWTEAAVMLLGRADPAIASATWLEHDLAGEGQFRAAAFDEDCLVGALLIDREPLDIDRAWLGARLGSRLDPSERFRLLAGRPGGAMVPRGPIVCFCCDVDRNEIVNAIDAGCTTVSQVGARTRAGINCGNCLGDVQQLIDAASQSSA